MIVFPLLLTDLHLVYIKLSNQPVLYQSPAAFHRRFAIHKYHHLLSLYKIHIGLCLRIFLITKIQSCLPFYNTAGDCCQKTTNGVSFNSTFRHQPLNKQRKRYKTTRNRSCSRSTICLNYISINIDRNSRKSG